MLFNYKFYQHWKNNHTIFIEIIDKEFDMAIGYLKVQVFKNETYIPIENAQITIIS